MTAASTGTILATAAYDCCFYWDYSDYCCFSIGTVMIIGTVMTAACTGTILITATSLLGLF